MPDGCIDVIVLGEGARVVGAMRSAIVVPSAGQAAIGARFRPGEAARILAQAPAELTDSDASLSDLWGGDGRALEASIQTLGTALHLARTPGELLAEARHILDAALLARLRAHGAASDLRVRAAADLLARGVSVSDVAKRVSLSERQLARRFDERVGIGPKLFARVMRLQRATGALGQGARIAFAAAEAGYADHAHFSRDSKELAGVPPRTLAAELLPLDASAMSESFKTGTDGTG